MYKNNKYAGIYEDTTLKTFYVKTQATSKDGIKVYITKRGFKSKTEALTFKLNEVERIKNNYSVREDNNKTLFYDYIESYLQSYKVDHELSTYKSVEGMVNNYIKPNIKNVRLENLRPSMFKDFREFISKQEMCSKSKNVRLRYLRDIIQSACDKCYIDNTQSKLILQELKALPNEQHETKNSYWEIDEYERFIASFEKDDKYYYLFRTMFATGCRISELRALKWSDINEENRTIRIDKQTTSKLGLGHWIIIKHTKTKEIRDVQISENLLNELMSFKRQTGMNDNCFLFFGHDPISENAVSIQKKKHCEIANVPYIRNHDFRHSYCTFLFDNGLDAKTIAGQLGHSNVSTTQNIYEHISNQRKTKLTDILSKMNI